MKNYSTLRSNPNQEKLKALHSKAFNFFVVRLISNCCKLKIIFKSQTLDKFYSLPSEKLHVAALRAATLILGF